MAKKVILKDDNIEIMPITRGELVLDSSGQQAFHSSQFLATQSQPGLMSGEDKTKLDSLEKVTVEDKKVEQVNTTTNSSYRILFSNSADDTTKTEGARKSAKLLFNPSTGALTATALIGKLDWSNLNDVPENFTPAQHIHNTSEITALTSYSKASSASDLVTTDTLNVALGKLEYKADTAYTFYKSITGTDNDEIINKWEEIVDFVDSVKEGSDITDMFVTRETDQTITGVKTFAQCITIQSGQDTKLVLNNTDTESKYQFISFRQNGTQYGYLGTLGDDVLKWSNNTILHSGNSYIQNGVITINGATITPITSHQSLANYVTLNGKQDITGEKTFKATIKAYDINPVTNNTYSLGTSSLAWKNVYATNGNFSSTVNASGFVKKDSSDSYVLLGGGGHKALSDFAMASAYVKKAGDTMTGRLTMTGEGIIVTTATTSNYRAGVEFYKGTAADTTYSYDAQIGWHNTGGDGTGSICILPYATSTQPWGGSVGLYISKTELKYNNQAILHSRNSSVSGGGSSGGSSITVNLGGTSKTLTIPTSLPANGGTSSNVVVNSSDANSTYRMVWHSGNTLNGTNNIYCNPSADQIYSAGFRHVSYNSASYLLRSDGGTAGFHWSGQGGQPTWLWGGNSQHTYYVYNPSNFNVNSAAKLRVVGCSNGTTNNDLWSTIKSSNSSYLGTSTMYEVYNDGGPTTYGHILDTVTVHSNHWQSQLWMAAGKGGRLYYRNKDYNNDTWGDWRTVAWTSDILNPGNYYWANVRVSASSSTSTQPTFNTCYTSNWFRSTGATGWYSESYGGGWYMTDTTYVRTYASKAVYVSNTEDHAIYTAGGFASARTSGSVFATYYNGTWYCDTLYTHGNGNLSISPPGGSLYLAYNRGNTYFGGGTYYINRSGYFNGTAAAANSVAWANVTGKPTIPSVGNGTVTIKQAGTTKGSFTMNQSGNTTIELTDNNTTYSFAPKGSATQGIYLAGTNTFAAMTYSLKATVNSGTSSKLAYYSGANAISAYTSTCGDYYKPIYLSGGVPIECYSRSIGSVTWGTNCSGYIQVKQFGPIVILQGYFTKINVNQTSSTNYVFKLPTGTPSPATTVGITLSQDDGYENDRNTIIMISGQYGYCNTGYNSFNPNGWTYYFSACYMA